MAFRYDEESRKVVDDETGVQIFEGGSRPEVDEWPFTFYDPTSTVKRWRKFGEFVFFVKPIYSAEKVTKRDGSVMSHVHLDGFVIARRVLQGAFADYTGGNSAKFEQVCELISEGLKEQLRGWDSTENPVIEIL